MLITLEMSTLAGKGAKVGLISSMSGFFYDFGLAAGRALVMVPEKPVVLLLGLAPA